MSKPTIETLLNHRSVRKYTGEPISDQDLTTILQAGRAVSTSSFLQAVSVVRVTDEKKRKAFRQIASGLDKDAYNEALAEGKRIGHGYVETAAEFLVFCMDGYRHQRLVPHAELDWTEVTLIGAIDVAIFAQNVLAAAESLGLGGVYIGGVRNDIAQASELLDLPKQVIPLFGMCLGHPDWDAKTNQSQRPRLPLDVLVSTDSYKTPSDEVLASYNDTVKDYYATRRLDLDWTQQIADTFGGAVRPELLDFLQARGFCRR